MASSDETPQFLALPFDWYILEKWKNSDSIEDSQQRRQKHIELGITYAELGHEERRPYHLKADKWRRALERGNQGTESLSRSQAEVPIDLLNAEERRYNNPEYTQEYVWIRTDYGPGTDARHEELLDGHRNYDTVYVSVANDSSRYNFTDDDLRPIFAFYPFLLERVQGSYLEEELPFDSEEIQDSMFGGKDCAERSYGDNEYDNEDPISWAQNWFFIADAEAMRTGFVRWIIPDQKGVPLLDERVQPWSLRDIIHTRLYNSHAQFRRKVARGYYGDDPRFSDSIVGPWEPPTSKSLREQFAAVCQDTSAGIWELSV